MNSGLSFALSKLYHKKLQGEPVSQEELLSQTKLGEFTQRSLFSGSKVGESMNECKPCVLEWYKIKQKLQRRQVLLWVKN